MILDGKTIIDKKMVELYDPALVNTDDQVQPNGVDLRLDRVYFLEGITSVPTDGKAKFEGRSSEILPKDGWFSLKPTMNTGSIYLVDFLEKINVREGYCANLITRSSLVRSGVDVITGLWDTGFQGQLGASLRVLNPINLQWGAKLAQVMFFESKFNGHAYTGRYQGSTSQTALAT